MNFTSLIDRTIAALSPLAGVKRAAARATLEALAAHTAADKGRRNKDWNPNPGSADLTIIPEKRLVLSRARDLARNTWVGKSAVYCANRNVVGRGIMPVAMARDKNGKLLTPFNRRANRLFAEWAEDKEICDVEKRQTFYEKQGMCAEERVIAGEHFVVWSYMPGQSGVGLRFQSVESDLLYDIIQSNPETGNQVRGGVEIDGVSAPVAYHFYTQNPYDYLFRSNFKPIRVPRERCFHYFKQERARQTSAISMFAPVMPDIRDESRNRQAHLWRSIMEACIGLVIKTNMAPPGIGSGASISLPRKPGDPGTTPSGMPTFDMVPGMTPVLRPGEDVVPFVPQAAGNNFDSFTEAVLRGIAAGLDISYEQLVRDFTRGTYSCQRQTMLEDRRGWKKEQDRLVCHFVAPMYKKFIQCAFLEGKFKDLVSIQDFMQSPARYTEAMFVGDGYEWIDPAKEVTAYEKAISLRLITRNEIVTARGGRFHNTMEEIADEKRLSQELDIQFPEDVNATAMLKGGIITPQTQDPQGGTGQPALPGTPPRPALPAKPGGDDEIEIEPSFDTVIEPEDRTLPDEAAPITSEGRVIGAPTDTFGPDDVFDNPQHNPEAAPGGY